mmetsp:Transcript_2404/g.10627  ORF Transcript_2404/g.10627 Transcript_2404/m.10627 type:complete len:214 (-) Transcript_2404:1754-2395(-)
MRSARGDGCRRRYFGCSIRARSSLARAGVSRSLERTRVGEHSRLAIEPLRRPQFRQQTPRKRRRRVGRNHGTFRPREVNHVPRRSSKGASVAKARDPPRPCRPPCARRRRSQARLDAIIDRTTLRRPQTPTASVGIVPRRFLVRLRRRLAPSRPCHPLPLPRHRDHLRRLLRPVAGDHMRETRTQRGRGRRDVHGGGFVRARALHLDDVFGIR